ncbi:hypothetical protein BBJ28_00003258 [Nothophytophthora sp. Chile5]|nr:hypothetical protein BBJ28_00003258 [Nothophytophthora sp. Chile5]
MRAVGFLALGTPALQIVKMEKTAAEERKRALEKKFVEKRPPLAYARLSGRVADDTPFEKLITHLPAELGRGPISEAPDHRITLGEQKAVSRLHARIQWNQSKSCFELVCLGKNGMFAAGKFVTKNQTIELASKMPLKIGHARLYFLCAIRSTVSTMSGYKLIQKVSVATGWRAWKTGGGWLLTWFLLFSMLSQAFEKAKYHKGLTSMSAEQICDQILESYPKSEPELGGKDHLLSFITYGLIGVLASMSRAYLQEDAQAFERAEGGSALAPLYKVKPVIPAASSTEAKASDSAKTDPTSESASKKQKTVD